MRLSSPDAVRANDCGQASGVFGGNVRWQNTETPVFIPFGLMAGQSRTGQWSVTATGIGCFGRGIGMSVTRSLAISLYGYQIYNSETGGRYSCSRSAKVRGISADLSPHCGANAPTLQCLRSCISDVGARIGPALSFLRQSNEVFSRRP